MNHDFLAQLEKISVGQLDQIFEMIPASIYCKDKVGKYIACNNNFLLEAKQKTIANILGSSDFDHIWEKNASIMQENDRAVIYGNKQATFVEAGDVSTTEPRSYLSYKVPLQSNRKKVIGTIGFSFLLQNKPICELFPTIAFSTNTSFSNKVKDLTKRQLECLKLLAQGMTMKQIAKVLGLSPKTVEHYLEATKIKLKCSSRYELIQIALTLVPNQ